MRPGPSVYPAPGCAAPAAQCPNGTNPGRTHRFYTGTPVLPFGFGLSYSSFTYSLAHAPPPSVVALDRVRALVDRYASRATLPSDALDAEAKEPLVSYAVNVTNTGAVDADDVVLGFVVPPGAGTDGIPLQSLFGFERVHLKAGESTVVWLYPSAAELTQVDAVGARRAHPGRYTVRFGLREAAHLGMGLVEHSFAAV